MLFKQLFKFIIKVSQKEISYIFFLLISCFVFSGCGKIWGTVTYNQSPGGSSGSSQQTYEYIYFGDQNNANLVGYSINKSTGVLTETPSPPAANGSSLVLGKIAGDAQMLVAQGGTNGGYWISPTTGILTPVTGTGFLSCAGNPTVGFSPSGLYIYSIAGSQTNGYIAQVNPTNGDFSNAVETANFSAPVTNAWTTLVSPNGNYVYFIDPSDNAIEGYSTSGGVLNVISGADTGSVPYGTHAGDVTYGLTNLPAPNAGAYTNNFPPYLDAAANVIYFNYQGNVGTNNWIMPYQINSDGSLTAGTPLNLGTNPAGTLSLWTVGDSTGKFLFVQMPNGSVGTKGINTYTIGVNGDLTYASGPAFSGDYFETFVLNSENSLIYGTGTRVVTASINMTTGLLTPVSNIATSCGNNGLIALDSSENYIYMINQAGTNVCGNTVNSSGTIGAISGQIYPFTIPGSGSIVSSIIVQMTSP